MAEPTDHYLNGMPSSKESEGFMRRWARRKSEVAREAARANPDAAVATDVVLKESVQADASPVELPPVDSLNNESDFTGFLSPEVDEALRKAALRKLFHLPDFNITDGLNDYDGDYTVFEPLGDVVPYHLKQWIAREAEAVKTALERSAEEDLPVEEAPIATRGDEVTEEPQRS